MAADTDARDTSLSLTYGPLLTTTTIETLDSGVIHDNVFNKDPFLSWLRSGKRIMEVAGGERLSLNIMYAKNTTYKRYTNYDALDTTPQYSYASAA